MKVRRGISAASASLVAALWGIPAALAQSDIGTSGGERGIEVVEAYLQDWVTFATGPWGLGVGLAGLVLLLTLWAPTALAGLRQGAVRRQGPEGLSQETAAISADDGKGQK